MKMYGSITFDWHGELQTVDANTPSGSGKAPEAIIDLRDEWIGVSRLGRGTALVPWSSVRALHGWSTATEGKR